MDRQQARQAFDSYVAAYDRDNPRIALKVEHTYHVARLCEQIAQDLCLSPADVDLAWLLGLLHDIGRFEQVRRYETFNDAASVSHAELGASLLFGGGDATASVDGVPAADADAASPSSADNGTALIRAFVRDNADDELIRTAIALHSAYRLPDALDGRTLRFCQILRDADKIDILRVNCECPIRDIYGVSEHDMVWSSVSPTCVDIFYQHRCLPRGVRAHPADIMLGHICFAWELVFDQSRRIVRDQGHLDQMLDRAWAIPETQRAFSAMAAHMRDALSRQAGAGVP